MAFLFSPVLYWVPGGGLGSPYPANGLEFVAQGVLDAALFCARLCYHLAPYAVVAAAASGAGQDETKWDLLLDPDWRGTAVAVAAVLVPAVLIAAAARAAGRALNPHYRQFHAVYRDALDNWTRDSKDRLSAYDFSFNAWPVEFTASDVRKT